MKETVYFLNEKKVTAKYYSVAQIKKFVVEIENEDLRPSEAARKYGVCYEAIRNWLKKYSKTQIPPVKHRISEELKKSIVRDIQSGILTKKEASIKANVTHESIKNWIDTYNCILNQSKMQDNIKSDLLKGDWEVEELKLKVLALETMIDVAENVLKVDIRKKFGTKQS